MKIQRRPRNKVEGFGDFWRQRVAGKGIFALGNITADHKAQALACLGNDASQALVERSIEFGDIKQQEADVRLFNCLQRAQYAELSIPTSLVCLAYARRQCRAAR